MNALEQDGGRGRLERGNLAWEAVHWVLAALLVAALGVLRGRLPPDVVIVTIALAVGLNALFAALSFVVALVFNK